MTLDNIFQLIKEQGQQDVVENPEVPNEQNNAVMAEASQSVAGTMQHALANGQAADVQQLFESGSTDDIMKHPLAQNMQGSFIDSITSKLGINKNVAMGIAASLIPMVLSKLVNRTKSNAPQDSGFNLPDLMKNLGGGSGGNGSFDLGGLIGGLTGGNNNATGRSGGLQDIIKGFFK